MALAAACNDDGAESPSATATVTVSISPTSQPTGGRLIVTPIPNVCVPNPQPVPAGLAPDDFGFKEVERPRSGDTVRSPLQVEGRANPFEGAYSITIFDGAGRVLATGNFNKNNLILAFSASVTFQVASIQPACIWVHERSGLDGSPVSVLQIPVLLAP